MGIFTIAMIAWPLLGLFLAVRSCWCFIRRNKKSGIICGVSSVLLILTWVGALTWLILSDPVPEEADSRMSRRGFEEVVGYPPPKSVSELRYKHTEFIDSFTQMRFACQNKADIEQLIETLKLMPQQNPFACYFSLDEKTAWWRLDQNTSYGLFLRRHKDNSGAFTQCLWVDSQKGILFYQDGTN